MSKTKPKFGEWQPIKTAPKDGTIILGVDKGKRIHVVYHTGRAWDGWQINSTDGKSHTREIEYWMPLPEAPKQINKGE